MRAVWPADRPMTVRISATDWHEGGTDVDDAVADRPRVRRARGRRHRRLDRPGREGRAAGVRPQLPDALRRPDPQRGGPRVRRRGDRGRARSPRWDDVNSILLAGRADLCALGRPHLYDPQWTLHAAAEQGYAGPGAAVARPVHRRAAAARRPGAPTGRGRGWSWCAAASRAPATPGGARPALSAGTGWRRPADRPGDPAGELLPTSIATYERAVPPIITTRCGPADQHERAVQVVVARSDRTRALRSRAHTNHCRNPPGGPDRVHQVDLGSTLPTGARVAVSANTWRVDTL